LICFYKKVWKMENISILYSGHGSKPHHRPNYAQS
jgi:hypothetical protein